MKKTLIWIALLAACTGQDAELRVEEAKAGDTLLVTSFGLPPLEELDHVEIFRQSPELEQLSAMISVNDRLIVADRTRIHLLPLGSDQIVSIGRSGEGPGEFGSVAAIAAGDRDTVFVLDTRLWRISYLSYDGEYLGSRRMEPATAFADPPRGSPSPVLLESRMFWVWEESLQAVGRPMRAALVLHDLGTDSTVILHEWEHRQWREFRPGHLAPTQLFPPQVLVASSRDGRIAVGDGLTYCVTIYEIGENQVMRMCRARERTPLGRGIRSADFGILEDDRLREHLRVLHQEQEIGHLLPSFDAVRFSESGNLWIRTIGEELANVHPFILARVPERGPSHRYWDVFDRGGRLEHTVRMPAGFDPRVIRDEAVFGFLELPTGEVVVARAAR